MYFFMSDSFIGKIVNSNRVVFAGKIITTENNNGVAMIIYNLVESV
jgi:hypothetical protein